MNFTMSIRRDATALLVGLSLLPALAMAQSDTGLSWDELTAAALLEDPQWQAFLGAKLTDDRVRPWQDYPDAQSARFTRQDDWHIAAFCAPAGCASERVVMAFAPESDTALLGVRSAEGVIFAGTARDPLPAAIVDLYQDSVSSAALRAAFQALPEHERRGLQFEMYNEGFYESDFPDGLYGPMTEGGAIAYAISSAALLGYVPNLSDEAAAGETLGALVRSEFVPIDAPAGSFAFEGVWSCDGTTLTLTSRSHQIGGSDIVPIAVVADYGDGSDFGMLLRGGDRIGVWDVTADSLSWYSRNSGDSLNCRRTADAPELPALTARPALPALPVAMPDAPAQEDAAAQSPAHAQEAALAEGLPFLGRWSCAGMEFTLAPGFGTNHAERHTANYESVSKTEPNLWDVTFADGVPVQLGMINDARMMMLGLEQVLPCERIAAP